MADLATVPDVAETWRPLSAQETTNALTQLERASALVRVNVPGIDARMALDANLSTVVVGVVVDMVLRVLKNPDGKRQESIDDYSWTRDNTLSAGALYLAPEELVRLLPAQIGLGSAFVVGLGG